jgi:hypothetical protein
VRFLIIILSLFLSSCAVNNIILSSKDKVFEIPAFVENAAKAEFSKDYNTPRIFEVVYDDKLYQYLIKEGGMTFHKCIRLHTNYMPSIIGGFMGAILIGMILNYR